MQVRLNTYLRTRSAVEFRFWQKQMLGLIEIKVKKCYQNKIYQFIQRYLVIRFRTKVPIEGKINWSQIHSVPVQSKLEHSYFIRPLITPKSLRKLGTKLLLKHEEFIINTNHNQITIYFQFKIKIKTTLEHKLIIIISMPIIISILFSLVMGLHISQNQQKPNIPDDPRPKLIMLGDSTLDNIVWVGSYQNCIKAQLQTLNPNRNVINLAADGFTSNDVIQGRFPSISYSQRQNVDPYPILKSQTFRPLQIYKNLSNIDYVVLSVGGNDIRTILSDMGSIQKASSVFLSNYYRICQNLLAKTPRVILMLQYKPSAKQSNYGIYQALSKLPLPGSPIQKLDHIMQSIYPKIFQLANKYNLPLIDLPNTFDPNDQKLYESQIQPSKKGGEIISSMISQVIKLHDYKKSLFYFKREGKIQTKANDGHWKASL